MPRYFSQMNNQSLSLSHAETFLHSTFFPHSIYALCAQVRAQRVTLTYLEDVSEWASRGQLVLPSKRSIVIRPLVQFSATKRPPGFSLPQTRANRRESRWRPFSDSSRVTRSSAKITTIVSIMRQSLSFYRSQGAIQREGEKYFSRIRQSTNMLLLMRLSRLM